MKEAQSYIDQWDRNSEFHLEALFEQAQKDAWNAALEAAAENADTEYVPEDGCATGDYYEVDKQSILKLKK